MLDTNDRVGELAAGNPAIRKALEELGIDYCCSGNRSLFDAAAAEGLPIQGVLAAIERETVAAGPPQKPWADRSQRELIAYLRHQHREVSLESLAHSAVVFELVAEGMLLDDDLLDPLRQAFQKFVNDLTPHIEREEHILFPIIEAMEEAWTRGAPPPPRFEGGLRAVVGKIAFEHESLNESLRQFRSGRALLACIDDRGCRTLSHQLERLERHLHESMNLESFVLFPRAIALEDQWSETTVASG